MTITNKRTVKRLDQGWIGEISAFYIQCKKNNKQALSITFLLVNGHSLRMACCIVHV